MAKNCHSHNTRRAAKNHLQIPSSNTKFGMRTFAYRASKLWNDLPTELLQFQRDFTPQAKLEEEFFIQMFHIDLRIFCHIKWSLY